MNESYYLVVGPRGNVQYSSYSKALDSAQYQAKQGDTITIFQAITTVTPGPATVVALK